MTSPGWTSSGRSTISFPKAQLAVLTSLTVQIPSLSLARSVSPAQFGQSKLSPLAIPAGITISCPHPWHQAFGIPPPLSELRQAQQALELPPVKPRHDLAVDDRHGRGPVPELQEFLQRRGVLTDILGRERDPFLRKKLFLPVAATSAGLRIDDDFFSHAFPLRCLSSVSGRMADLRPLSRGGRGDARSQPGEAAPEQPTCDAHPLPHEKGEERGGSANEIARLSIFHPVLLPCNRTTTSSASGARPGGALYKAGNP